MVNRGGFFFICGILFGASILFVLFFCTRPCIRKDHVSRTELSREEKLLSRPDEVKEIISLQNENRKFKQDLEEKNLALTKTENELVMLRERISRLESERAALEKRLSETSTETSGKKVADSKPAEDVHAEELKNAIKKYMNTIRVGGEVPASAIEELSLSENQVSGINDALKEEECRLTQIMADFYRANVENGMNEDLGGLGISQILMKMLPKISADLQKLGKLSQEEQFQLMKGERSVLDYIGRNSFTARLAYELYKGRQRTYEDLSLFIDENKHRRFIEKYLPKNAFIFPGNLALNFGEESWEEK